MGRRIMITILERSNNDSNTQARKARKAKTEATSYRPISLTSCMVKLLERIINTRLKWFLETEKLLVPQQAGFREHHCTEDQTTYLAQGIEKTNAFSVD